jgi:hypothetical protein
MRTLQILSAEEVFGQPAPSHSPGIGLAGGTDPAHGSVPDLIRRNLVPGILFLRLAQPAADAPGV